MVMSSIYAEHDMIFMSSWLFVILSLEEKTELDGHDVNDMYNIYVILIFLLL